MTTLLDRLLGSWELTAYTLTLDTGQTFHPLGESAVGSLVYTPQSRVSVNVMRPGRNLWASPIPGAGSADETVDAAGGYVAYAGRFVVDEAASRVEHRITVALVPNWVGQTQKRLVELAGDELVLVSPAVSDGVGNSAVPRLRWRQIN